MFQTPFCSTHFCKPAVACDCGSATLPFTGGVTNVPSPSSHTYNVFALAKNIPNGKFVPVLASVFGKPGRIVSGTFANSAAVPVGKVPWAPSWNTELIPLPPLPLLTYTVLLKMVMPRKFVSLPCLSPGRNSNLPIMSMPRPGGGGGTGG